MKQDFFKYLPSKIMIDILSRLPDRSIAISKCVSKPWLHLLETDEFVKSHRAKSVPVLVVFETDSASCTIFEFEDGQDLEQHDLHYNPLTKFDFPHDVQIHGYSANGLLFLYKLPEVYCVCNPITREYIEVHFPEELIRPYPRVVNYPEILQDSVFSWPHSVTYGFGASKVTGQYKVVRIFHDCVIAHGNMSGRRIIPEPECYVYTLGTGLWRRVEPEPEPEPGVPLEYSPRTSCVFLNGNLHWAVTDSDDKLWISVFDLETERFTSFSTPPIHQESFELICGLSTLGDCLCLCDHTREEETVIWLMKEYGVEESWSKEYAFAINGYGGDLVIEGWELVYPIKVFEDGDILMESGPGEHLFYFSHKTETAQEIGIFDWSHRFNSTILTPSLLSLKTFGIENVVSF